MKKTFLLFCCALSTFYIANAQFAPPAGQIGSTAIHTDSNCFISWAMNCSIQRGFVNISDTTLQYNNSVHASYGEETDAIGITDGIVVSLGDNGIASLEFDPPISNGENWDFAVFENALNDTFLELAFIEVSSDGINYFRFPSTSLTQYQTQTPGFGDTDATKINNLAGKYRSPFGTPFNLDDVPDNDLLDKNSVRFVKIIDVVGSIDPSYSSFDSHGNPINDPWPTPYNTCGFDLDAIGVINNTTNTRVNQFEVERIKVFPNPTQNTLNINAPFASYQITILNIQGQVLQKEFLENSSFKFDISNLKAGYYLLELKTQTSNGIYKFIKQ